MTVALLNFRDDPLAAESADRALELDWSEFYERYFDLVWRGLRRLGVAESALDDAAQEVFLIAFRRIDSFEGRSSLKTWLYGIALHVARRFHSARAAARPLEELSESLPAPHESGPQETAVRAEAVRALYAILAELDADKREVFVLAELEQMTAPEIARATEVGLNTVYSRLRAARREFEAALKRLHAQDEWRMP
jgi:RNA polymerase sigma-70 factor (ECF subfamily)